MIQSMLFGVTPNDALTFAVALGAIALAALMACLVPAIRATRIDPAITLRAE